MEEQGNLDPSFLSLRFRNMNKIENWSTKKPHSKISAILPPFIFSLICPNCLDCSCTNNSKNVYLETKHGPVIRRVNKLAAIVE